MERAPMAAQQMNSFSTSIWSSGNRWQTLNIQLKTSRVSSDSIENFSPHDFAYRQQRFRQQRFRCKRRGVDRTPRRTHIFSFPVSLSRTSQSALFFLLLSHAHAWLANCCQVVCVILKEPSPSFRQVTPWCPSHIRRPYSVPCHVRWHRVHCL